MITHARRTASRAWGLGPSPHRPLCRRTAFTRCKAPAHHPKNDITDDDVAGSWSCATRALFSCATNAVQSASPDVPSAILAHELAQANSACVIMNLKGMMVSRCFNVMPPPSANSLNSATLRAKASWPTISPPAPCTWGGNAYANVQHGCIKMHAKAPETCHTQCQHHCNNTYPQH